MLSIGKMSRRQCEYYLSLSQEDYYLEGGEPGGLWWGYGAGELGLCGGVGADELRNVFNGFAPRQAPCEEEPAKLVQNAGRYRRQPGWDLTFSAPKSVSVLWASAEPRIRQRIQYAHDQAVEDTLLYLECEVGCSRIGKGGKRRQWAGLVVATFQHGTSRALDPQLHTHALVLNVGVGEDGKTRSIESRPFYEHKMLAGAYYRCALSRHLQNDVGLICRQHHELEQERSGLNSQKKTGFEVEGVPPPLMECHSTRRKEIETELGKLGLDSASASAYAALKTRPVKELVPPREQLFGDWQAKGREYGFSPDQVPVRYAEYAGRSAREQLKAAFEQAVETLTSDENHFTRHQLRRRMLEAAQGRGLRPWGVVDDADRQLKDNPEIVRLGERDGTAYYSTREIVRQEDQIVELAAKLHQKKNSHPVSRLKLKILLNHTELRLRDGKPRLIKLNPEQREAVRHVTKGTGQIALVTGIAGTGKTTMLKVARKVWELKGYRVIGCALSGKAAKELHKGSGIKSETLQSLLLKSNPSLKYRLRYHAKGLMRAALRKPAAPPKPYLNKKTVVVLDEASMVSNRQFLELLREVKKSGAKLVCTGDSRQLSAIERGGVFRALVNRLGCVELKTIVRQRDEWARQAVIDAREHKIDKVLKAFKEHGCVHMADDPQQSLTKLLEKWTTEQIGKLQDGLILVGTRQEARDLNQHCQRQRLKRDNPNRYVAQLPHVLTQEGERVHVGDRILIRSSHQRRKHDLKTGELATVVRISPRFRSITVRVDGERKQKRISLKQADDVTLGYAVTTHAAQGTTVKNAYVLLGGAMQDAEMFYTQISRASHATHLFVDKQTVGRYLHQLEPRLARSHEKSLTRELIALEQKTLASPTKQQEKSEAKQVIKSEPELPAEPTLDREQRPEHDLEQQPDPEPGADLDQESVRDQESEREPVHEPEPEPIYEPELEPEPDYSISLERAR